MDSPTLPADESARLDSLKTLRLLDTDAEEVFDALIRLACHELGGEAAVLGLLDADREWFKARQGVDQAEVPREASLAARHFATATPQLMVGPLPASAHAYAQALLGPQANPNHAWLAGAALIVEDHLLGTLVVAGRSPRSALSSEQNHTLQDIATTLSALLSTRLTLQRQRVLEARVRTASLASSDWLWETDAEGHFTWVSDNVTAHLGLLPHDVIGYKVLEQCTPDPMDVGQVAWQRYLQARQQMQPFSGMLARYRAKDVELTLWVSGQPVFDSAGAFRGYRGAGRDISNRNRSEVDLSARESQLKLTEARLSAVLSALPDLWFVLDHNNRFQDGAGTDHPLLTRSFTKLRGRPYEEGLPIGLTRQADLALRRARQTGLTQRIEIEHAIEGEPRRHFEVRLSPMPGGQILLLARDLTELASLKRDVQLMEHVLEAEVSLAIMVTDALDPAWPIIYVNPAFEQLTGYRRSDVLGHGVELLVDDDQHDLAGMQELRLACTEGRSCTVVVETRRRNGTRFLNQWHLSPVRDAQNRVTHFISVLHDVTERTREAEKLRVSEELYRSVASAISDGLLVVTLDGRTAAINPAACKILGVSHEAMIGQREPYPFDLLEPDLSPLTRERFPVRRVLKEGRLVSEQIVALRRTDGELRWLSINCHPLRMAPDEPIFSAVATFRDITESRQAAQALKQSEERWKFALEGAGDGVWDWDIPADRVFYSRRWKTMLGFDEAEVGEAAREWFDRIHPDDRSMVVRALRQYVSGMLPEYTIEYRMRHKDGHDVWVLDRGKIVDTGPNGQPRRVVGTHSDVTRQREAEAALRDKRAAELASRAKSEFLSRMSHEIRTPLNAVLGFAQLLKLSQQTDEATRQEQIDQILNAGQHLLTLVNDVLDLQRVEEGRLSLDLRPLDLGNTVAHCLSLLAPLAESTQVTLLNQVPNGITVQADAQRLRQVLLNIGANGIKYNRAGGQERWSIELNAPGRVTLSIEDDGAGMSEEQLTRLFQPFERLGKETSSIEGSGLGLIIARNLAAEMHGSLDVLSQIGRGTRVLIELPCIEVREPCASTPTAAVSALPSPNASPLLPPEATCPAAPPDATGRPMRLMYVEDNRINAMLFEQALKLQPGFDLRIAEDGQHALEIASQWVPDVLVLDAHLPGMSGFEALVALRTLPGLAHTPAFMCSADAMPEDVQRALDAGFIGYWTKPIEVQQVLGALDALRPSLNLGHSTP